MTCARGMRSFREVPLRDATLDVHSVALVIRSYAVSSDRQRGPPWTIDFPHLFHGLFTRPADIEGGLSALSQPHAPRVARMLQLFVDPHRKRPVARLRQWERGPLERDRQVATGI